MNRIYKVVHSDGREWTLDEIKDYVLKNEPNLVWCDMVGVLIDDVGVPYLADECGHWAYADPDVFWVVEK